MLPAVRRAESPAGRIQTALFDREYRIRAAQVRVYRVPVVVVQADGLQRSLRTFGHGARHGSAAFRRIFPPRRIQHPELQHRRLQRRGAERQGQEQEQGHRGTPDAETRRRIAAGRVVLLGRIRRGLPQARPLRGRSLLRPRSGRRARRIYLRHDGRPRQRRLVRRGRVARDEDAAACRALRYLPRKHRPQFEPPDQLHGGPYVAAGEVPALPAELYLRRLRCPRRLRPQCGCADKPNAL